VLAENYEEEMILEVPKNLGYSTKRYLIRIPIYKSLSTLKQNG
jgi:hypothetical protein